MATPKVPDIKVLMEAGVHFGHASGHWHPKMKPFIFATRDKLHIIDLEKTKEQLESVLPILEERIRSGKSIIIVGTKKQVSDRVKEIGENNHVSYINVRWPGGVLTNWVEIQKSVARMKRLEEFLSSSDATKTIKKERVMMESELRRMHYKFGGLRDLTKKPDALFVIDPSHEHNAIKEARHEGIEIFGIVDTNCDPRSVDHLIPGNDDGPKSIKLLLDLVEQTIKDGQKLISVSAEETPAAEATELEPEVIIDTPTIEAIEDKEDHA